MVTYENIKRHIVSCYPSGYNDRQKDYINVSSKFFQISFFFDSMCIIVIGDWDSYIICFVIHHDSCFIQYMPVIHHSNGCLLGKYEIYHFHIRFTGFLRLSCPHAKITRDIPISIGPEEMSPSPSCKSLGTQVNTINYPIVFVRLIQNHISFDYI